MRILFIDSETTGFPLFKEPSDHPDQPYIVDLACELWDCDDDKRELADSWETLINPGVPIPPEVSAIHGITDEMVQADGVPNTKAALVDFFSFANRADLIVGHNISFDIRMVRIQMARTYRRKWEATVPTFCTMKASTDICKIPSPYKRGFKWPKLSEAVKHFFDEDHADAHRAMPDVVAARRIYFHMHPHPNG